MFEPNQRAAASQPASGRDRLTQSSDQGPVLVQQTREGARKEVETAYSTAMKFLNAEPNLEPAGAFLNTLAKEGMPYQSTPTSPDRRNIPFRVVVRDGFEKEAGALSGFGVLREGKETFAAVIVDASIAQDPVMLTKMVLHQAVHLQRGFVTTPTASEERLLVAETVRRLVQISSLGLLSRDPAQQALGRRLYAEGVKDAQER